MGLSEPVSGSHVAADPGPDPGSSYSPPPPSCSLPLPFDYSSSPTSNNPKSTVPPPPIPVSLSDPAPANVLAPSSGSFPPPAVVLRPDLAPDHCSAADPRLLSPFQASVIPRSTRSAPPSPTSSAAGILSSSGGPVPASHGPIMGPSANRAVLFTPNPQITPDSLPPASIVAPITSGQVPPHSILSSRPHPPPSGRSSGATPPLSYAQAARGPRGPGFVRSHAADVESFARLPRTGINIICGSREGAPSFSFVSSDLPKVEDLYSNALVMRFLGGRPSLEASHKEILNWGIEKPFSIGPMSSKAFLLRFQDSKDLVRVLSRPSSTLITFPYKVFRWHNQCHIKEDSCFAPVWISMPKLPLQCFIPEFLEAVANKIGRFLCFDKATATLARPSVARMCVELDLRKNQPPFIWIGLFEGFKQPVIYERLPKFCSNCLSQGHLVLACPWGQRGTLPIQTQPRSDLVPERPPPIRRYAPKGSSTYSQPHSGSATFKFPPTSVQHSSTIPTTPLVPPSARRNVEPFLESINQPDAPPPEQQHHSDPIPQYHPSTSQLPAPDLSLPPLMGSGEASSSLPSKTVSSQPPPPQIQLPTLLSSVNPKASQPRGSPALRGPNHIGTSSDHSKKSIIRKGKKKKKSVSFNLPGQSNLSANTEFWSAVSSHIAMLDQVSPSQADDPIPVPIAVEDVQPSSPPTFQTQPDQDGDESSVSPIAADSPSSSPLASSRTRSYASEGEDTITERSPMLGHSTDDLLDTRRHHSKKNKRHPDQPLKVQLRVRKDPSSTTQ